MRLHQGSIDRVQKFKYLGLWLRASGREKLNFNQRPTAGKKQTCHVIAIVHDIVPVTQAHTGMCVLHGNVWRRVVGVHQQQHNDVRAKKKKECDVIYVVGPQCS